jgi:FkbM family methyltransferase
MFGALFVATTQFICGIYFLSKQSCSVDVVDTNAERFMANDERSQSQLKSNLVSQSPTKPESSIATDFVNASSETKLDPDALDCKSYLLDYRSGKIGEMERSPGWDKSYVTRTTTSKPFYWSTHSPDLDSVRASSFKRGQYYESKLSDRIQETFDAKTSDGKESIFLDVGGNIGWFSLLAAAHGATKVYTFEPNPANLVRICESLAMNGWLGHDQDRSNDIVIPVAKGVGEKDATQKLYRSDETNPGSYSFSKRRAITQFKKANNEGKPKLSNNEKRKYLETDNGIVGEIELITLDSFAEKHGWFESRPTIGFFKLDVEGFEKQIIQGAKKLFKSRIVELFDMEMKTFTPSKDKYDMLEVIFNAGYELYMHGGFKGPKHIVEKNYSTYLELAADVTEKKYGENLLFRRRKEWKN